MPRQTLSHTWCHSVLMELGKADVHILEKKTRGSEGPADLPGVAQRAPGRRGTRTRGWWAAVSRTEQSLWWPVVSCLAIP